MSCVLMLQRGHSGDGCVLASTLCKYDFRNGDLFVLSWARVRRDAIPVINHMLGIQYKIVLNITFWPELN